VTDHQLFLFLADVTVLLVAARIGSEISARLGIPLHVGELVMGLLLGPSLLGWLWPGASHALFPKDVSQRSLLEIVSWTGIIFLVLLGGLETRLAILRSAGRAVIGGWIGGFGLPFVGGFFLGMAFPRNLIPSGISQPLFALFLATAMSISAIPVIARILMDLNLYQTRLGMVILSTAIADDTIGWIVLAVVAGLAAGRLETGHIVTTLTLTAAFLVFAFTLGRRLVKAAMYLSRRHIKAPEGELAMMIALVFGAGALTQAIGVHLVLGAFVASILIGRVKRTDTGTIRSIRTVGMGFFVPFFFAYTGLKVDLTTLHGNAAVFTVLAVLVACLGKVIGGSIGSRLGGLPKWEAIAVGFGLNARGAMELVIAAVGLSIGLLNETSYAIIVLIAVLTTVMAAPLLKVCVKRAGPEAIAIPEEVPVLPPEPALVD
jgi:K+:H+ antiporter